MKGQRSCQPLVLVLGIHEKFTCLWNAEKVSLSWVFSVAFCCLKMEPQQHWIDKLNQFRVQLRVNWCNINYWSSKYTNILLGLCSVLPNHVHPRKALWCRQVSWAMKAAGSCSWTLETLFCWPWSQNTQERKDETTEMFRVQPHWEVPPALQLAQGKRDCTSQEV